MQNSPVLSVDGLTLRYGQRVLCSGIRFEVFRGDCILLCGANGSGKSTLLRALAMGGDLAVRGDGVVMVPSGIPKVRGFTLEEFVRTGCFVSTNWAGALSQEQKGLVDRAMARLRLTELRGRDISGLSDGEFRKACIATALCRKAEVLLLDEPTAFLDAENRLEALDLLREIALSSGTAVIFSSHDMAEAVERCNRVAAIGADGVFRISGGNGDGVADGGGSDVGGSGGSGKDGMDEKWEILGTVFRNPEKFGAGR